MRAASVAELLRKTPGVGREGRGPVGATVGSEEWLGVQGGHDEWRWLGGRFGCEGDLVAEAFQALDQLSLGALWFELGEVVGTEVAP